MKWSERTCEIAHPQYGRLEVDTSSGCPEVSTTVALDLIKRYESLVGRQQVREIKISKMMQDMIGFSKVQLAEIVRKEGSEAEAALRILISNVFPLLPTELLDQLVTPVQEVTSGTTWNRRTRRRHAKSKGILLHVFCGESRGAFESTAERLGLSHLAVDLKEDLLRQSTYQYLMLEAIRGDLKMIVGGPPCRSYSICRYLPLSENVLGPRPVRTRGDSLSSIDFDVLTGSEIAMRQVDDLLYLRYMSLYVVATECSRSTGLPDPGFGLEQPEDPERWSNDTASTAALNHATNIQKHRPKDGFASFWSTPEWRSLEEEYDLQLLHFDQGLPSHHHDSRSLPHWVQGAWDRGLECVWILHHPVQGMGHVGPGLGHRLAEHD